MEKLKLLLAFLFISFIASSQAGQINQIKIVNFTVKNQLPGTVDSWLSTPAALLLTVQKVPGSQLREPMMVLQIRIGSAVICGTTTANPKRVDPFDVRVFNTADLTALLGNCHELKAGTYTICVQFFNSDKVAISQEMCKDFRVEDAAVEYAPPSLTTPDNGKKFTPQELQGVVMFRWTPLVPKPKEPVTYRLKVWQLMQGQNGTQAMRSNQPIVTKDVDNITQATVSGIYTGPCRPPYLCDYIWNVQALNRNGKPMGNNNGTGEPYTFGVTEEKSKGPVNVFPEEKKIIPLAVAEKEITFRWSQIAPRPQEPVKYRLKVWQLMQGQNSKEAMNSNNPLYTFDIDGNGQADALTDGLMVIRNFLTGPCKPPYLCDFVWNVQVVTRDGTPGATSESTTFSVTEEKSNGPANLFPEDKKKFTPEEAKKEMIFRWTPIVPKPQEPVTYRLKVWQLMQGQSGSQAMKTNQPIVTKDVDNLTEATISNLWTGPCRPPYLCDFIWVVEARIKNANGISELIATSSPYAFLVVESTDDTSIIEARITLSNSFPENKREFKPDEIKQSVTFRWTPIVPKPQEPVTYRLRVWQLMQGQSGSQAMKTNQPIVTKDVLITEVGMPAISIYTGPCKPPYLCDFIWSVEAITRQAGTVPKTIGTSEPTTFRVKEETGKCPSNLFPEDKNNFNTDQAKQSITFKWSKNETPGASSAYRLKVWQLMQGQSGSQAMRTNQPIVTKDVDNITEATVSGIYTGPCRPPYLCDYIWVVETRNTAGQTSCNSEPTTFSVKEENVKCPTNTFPEDKKKFTPEEGKKEMLFRWTPVVPKPQEPVTYRLKVWQLMQGQNGSQAMRTNQPIVTKDVDNITQATVSSLYTGPCRPPYLCDYIWMVEAVSKDGHTGCAGEPTTFTVTEETVKCPANLFPEDKKRLDLEEVKRSITFKWTKTETPGESSAYRLKVWQLMQGQNGTQAMKSNTPVVTKEVRNASEITVNGILTGPCRPPYLCDFIWAVEKISANGQVSCSSQPTMFFVTQYIIQLDSIKVLCTAKPGVYSFSYTISNVNPGTANLTNLAITSSVPAGATMGSFTPPLGTSIGSGNQLTITGTINAAPNLSNICIGAEITDAANSFWKASKDTCVKVEPCRCDACDEKNFVMNLPKPAQITTTNNSISFNQPVTITTTPPKTIKSIKAELVYFEMKPENDLCIPCDKDARLYGHFSNGTNSQQWNGPQTSLSISITTPVTPCCSTLFRWCIRYKVEFTDCTVCTKLICYEKKKTGCTPAGGGGDNPILNNPK